MTARKASSIPCDARIRRRWHPAKILDRDGHLVTVLYEGKTYTVTEDDVREPRKRHYSIEED